MSNQSITIQTENTTSITSLTQTHNILQQSKAKKTLSLTTAATQQTSHRPSHSHYNLYKTNMRHIHTSIVSRHLATRGNNKILRTPLPHISSSEDILPRLTRRTLAQLRTNKSPFLKVYTSIITMPLCNTHTHDTHPLFNCTHIRTLGHVSGETTTVIKAIA